MKKIFSTKVVFLYLLIAILCSCNSNQYEDIFNGTIHYIADEDVVTKNIVSKHVSLDGDQTGMIATYDSLLVCYEPDYPRHFLKVFNVDTGEDFGYFCPKGHGPKEFAGMNPIYQFFKKGEDVVTLFDGDLKSWAFLNLTKSIKSGETVYDTIFSRSSNNSLFFFYTPNNNIINVISAEYTNVYESTTPYCEIYNIYNNNEVKKIPIYKVPSVTNKSAVEPVGRFFNTWDALKPDGTKLVQAMSYLPQLNIIDTNTGEVKAYRINDDADYSLLQTEMNDLKRYYLSVQADDNYIYAAYWGKELWDGSLDTPMPIFDQIHVFDWNGNLLYKLKTDHSYFVIWLDTVRNRLYTRNWDTDEIYFLDLNELK